MSDNHHVAYVHIDDQHNNHDDNQVVHVEFMKVTPQNYNEMVMTTSVSSYQNGIV